MFHVKHRPPNREVMRAAGAKRALSGVLQHLPPDPGSASLRPSQCLASVLPEAVEGPEMLESVLVKHFLKRASWAE